MQFPWPFRNRRAAILAEPFPEAWLAIIDANVWHYALLTPSEQGRLRDDLRVFLAEKYWEGAQGLVVTDEIKVTVSALACLMTVGFELHDYFPNVETILIYPSTYVAPAAASSHGIVDMDGHARFGEAHGRGPVVLSWSDTVDGAQNEADGENLVFHEFAHKLDFRDGYADGVPFLRDTADVEEWARVMSAAYSKLVDDVRHYRHAVLRPYGATNSAEFFAVCTETFFEQPVRLRDKMPELYGVLRDYYGIDWAERMGSTGRIEGQVGD